jgi:D-alanyl-lipoteichoic acid acyltransferase DltB (MBOAT superfamily)
MRGLKLNMLFDSPIYIFFLAVVVLLFWRLHFRAQNYFLVAASYFFYGWWDWRFLLLLAFSSVMDFFVARAIEDASAATHRKALLILSVSLNLAFLGFFKYCNFFVDSFARLAPVLGLSHLPQSFLQVVLPPAISFYTFQEIAYIVDVYKGRLRASRSLVDYALFVSLFPHLIAGPIQRPSHLLPQIQRPRTWSADKAFDGMLLILEGLFRKVVIADNCALVANGAFGGNFGPPNTMTVILGTVAFAFQIYGDFSGYSSIARGSAQLLGFHFDVNFRQPYLAQSLQDFWRRWHISLSRWLRDYLYIPLGGNRRGTLRTYVNLMLTMLLGGLWHGANWTFVVWGGIHGLALALERLLTGQREIRDSTTILGRSLRRVAVFTVVCVAWIYFRSPTLAAAREQLHGLFAWNWQPVYGIAAVFLSFFVALMLLVDVHIERWRSEYLFEFRTFSYRVAVGVGLCVLTTLWGSNQTSAFIYFRF